MLFSLHGTVALSCPVIITMTAAVMLSPRLAVIEDCADWIMLTGASATLVRVTPMYLQSSTEVIASIQRLPHYSDHDQKGHCVLTLHKYRWNVATMGSAQATFTQIANSGGGYYTVNGQVGTFNNNGSRPKAHLEFTSMARVSIGIDEQCVGWTATQRH